MPIYTPAEIKAIFRCFANLPASSYLELDLTLDQLRYWLGHKGISLGMAEYWKVLHTGERSSLLDSLPDGYRKQKMWLCTLLWQRFWEMTLVCFPTLKQIAEECLHIPFPFAAPVELFARALAECVNSDFAVCLQPYVEISSPKAEKIYKKLARNPSFTELEREWNTPAGRKRIERDDKEADVFLRQSGGHDFWLSFTLLFSFFLAASSGHVLIESAVESYRQSLANLAKLDAKQRHKAPSTCWHNGIKKRGSRGGTYS